MPMRRETMTGLLLLESGRRKLLSKLPYLWLRRVYRGSNRRILGRMWVLLRSLDWLVWRCLSR
jgi:hypothetical protein